MDQRLSLLGLAAHGLPTSHGAVLERPPADPDWRRLRSAVRDQRVTGQAVLAADAGLLPLTELQRDQLEDDHVAALAHVVRLERALLRVHDVLAAADVPFVVLKGSAVAHLDYPDPSHRAFGDNDVLLPSDRFDQAVALLLDHGHERPVAQLGPGFDARFGKGATLVATDRTELDVHRTLAMGPYGLLVGLEELWDRPTGFELAGRRLLALGTEQRCLHACFHAVLGNAVRRVLPYRDIAEMLVFGKHDPDRLRELARSWSAEVVLATAVRETWDALGLAEEQPLVRWARERPTTPREERLMGVYRRGTSYAAKSLAGLTVIPGWRDRASYLRMLAFPDDQSLAFRGSSRWGWVTRGARRVVHDLRTR